MDLYIGVVTHLYIKLTHKLLQYTHTKNKNHQKQTNKDTEKKQAKV